MAPARNYLGGGISSEEDVRPDLIDVVRVRALRYPHRDDHTHRHEPSPCPGRGDIIRTVHIWEKGDQIWEEGSEATPHAGEQTEASTKRGAYTTTMDDRGATRVEETIVSTAWLRTEGTPGSLGLRMQSA